MNIVTIDSALTTRRYTLQSCVATAARVCAIVCYVKRRRFCLLLEPNAAEGSLQDSRLHAISNMLSMLQWKLSVSRLQRRPSTQPNTLLIG